LGLSEGHDCELTLRKNEIVGLDEVVEGVLLQLDDIRGRSHRGGGEQAEGELLGLVHFGFS
jgi:hypothetical protein